MVSPPLTAELTLSDGSQVCSPPVSQRPQSAVYFMKSGGSSVYTI